MTRLLLFIGVVYCFMPNTLPAASDSPGLPPGTELIHGEMIVEKSNHWTLDGVAILNSTLILQELSMTNGSLLMISPTGQLTANTITQIPGSKTLQADRLIAGWDFEDSNKRVKGIPYKSDSGNGLNKNQAVANLEGNDIDYLFFRGSYRARISDIMAGDYFYLRDISTLGHENITLSFRQYLAKSEPVSVRLEARPCPASGWVHIKDFSLNWSDWKEGYFTLPPCFDDRESIMIRWKMLDHLNPGDMYIDDIVVKGQGISGIIVRSTPEGTGSLITNTPGVKARVEQYIPRYSIPGRGWHMLSSPVESQAIRPEFFPSQNEGPAYRAIDFYRWDETGGTQGIWRNIKASQFGPEVFKTGHAYLVAYAIPDNETEKQYGDRPHAFTGIINIENVTANNLSVSNGGGWHLLGNPFPSAIYWDTDNPWPGTIQGTPQVYSEAESAYVPVIKGIIPPMNGFMIQTPASNGELTIPAESRRHSDQPWYKQQPASSGDILLMAKDPEGETAQRSHILFRDDATPGLDRRDTRYLAGQAPAFYSVKSGNHLSLQTLPGIFDGLEVPFGFEKNNNTNFRLTMTSNMDQESLAGYHIYLDDLKKGLSHRMDKDTVYEFTAASGDDEMRFVLRFSKDTETGTPEPFEDLNDARVWVYNQQLHIKTGREDTQAAIVDASGRTWESFNQPAGTTTSRPIDGFRPGVYIVRLHTPQKTEARKVVISR